MQEILLFSCLVCRCHVTRYAYSAAVDEVDDDLSEQLVVSSSSSLLHGQSWSVCLSVCLFHSASLSVS